VGAVEIGLGGHVAGAFEARGDAQVDEAVAFFRGEEVVEGDDPRTRLFGAGGSAVHDGGVAVEASVDDASKHRVQSPRSGERRAGVGVDGTATAEVE